MESARVQTDSVEVVTVYAVNRQNIPLTGLTDLYIRIRRKSDGFFLDWNDSTFKSTGWTTLNGLLSEDDATNAAGLYSRTFDMSAITNQAADDVYTIITLQTPGTSAVIPPPVDIREGDYVDNIDATISSRATQAQILSDATPFAGANIAAILADTDSLDTTKLTTARANLLDNLTELDLAVGFVGGRVYVDSVNGVASTTFPAGTIYQPTNTMERAKTIANAQGLRTINLHGDGTLASSFEDFNLEGDGALHDTLNIGNQRIEGVLATNLTIQGTILSGTAKFVDCLFSGVVNFKGEAYRCAFEGTTQFVPGTHILADCFSNVAGSLTPIFDLPNAGEHNISVRRWSGGFDIRNVKDALDDISLDINQGNVLIASNCVGGTIVVRGDAGLTDNSTGSTVVDNRTSTLSADAVWDELIAQHLGAGSTGAALNASGGAPTVGQIADAVWDELQADHLTVGTTGASLNLAQTGGDPQVTADRVWDTLRSAHTVVGSFGETIRLTAAGLATDAANEIRDSILSDSTPFAGANIAFLDASVASRAAPGAAMDLVANAIDAAAVATSGAEEIAAAVWDEDLTTHLPFPNSAAEYLERLDVDVSTRAAPGAQMALTVGARDTLVDSVWDEPTAGHTGAGTTGKALTDASVTGDPSVFAAAVWDLPIAGHTTPGTTGELQGRVDVAVSTRAQPGDVMGLAANAITATVLETTAVNEIRDAILSDGTPFQGARIDAAISSRAAPGDAMDLVANAVDAASLDASASAEIADQVWDEPLADHLGAGSTGAALDAIAAPATPATIAAAVWDEPLAGHLTAGTAGVYQSRVDVAVSTRAAPGDAMDLVVDAVDTAALASSAVTEIQSAILLDATPFAGANLDAAISTRAVPGDAMDLVLDAVDSAAVAASGANELADAFLDRALAGHTGVGTVGERLGWVDVTVSSRAAPGADMGLTVAGAGLAADYVWDESLAAHQGAGSTGEGLTDAAGTTDPAVIASAVWDALRSSYGAPGTMGEAQQDLGSLLTQIQKIDQAAVDSPPAVGSLVDILTNKDGSQTYDQSTDSLEAIKDRIG